MKNRLDHLNAQRLLRPFVEHPASVGETYVTHLGTALGFSARLLGASLACAAHALLPFAFQRTASRQIDLLHRRMVTHRSFEYTAQPRSDIPGERDR